MPKHRKPFLSDLAAGFREVNRSHAELAGLIRSLEYPAVLDRIRSPPVTLLEVLAGIVQAALILAVRLPLHALARIAALLPDPPFKPEPQALGADLRSLLVAVVFAGDYTAHWLGILGRVLWIELKILGMAAATGAFLGVAYAALLFGGLWLLLFLLS